MNLKKEINLIKDIGKAKRTKRNGWLREGIIEAESVADHSYRVAVMALIFGNKLNVDTDKLVALSLLHDLAEGIMGDLVIERGLDINDQRRKVKEKLEFKIFKKMFNGVSRKDITTMFGEIINYATSEAKILKQLERLEMAVQALEYEEQYGKDLSEFFENADYHISHPYLKELFITVKNLRPKN